MRLDKLERQIAKHRAKSKRKGDSAQRRLTTEIADIDARISKLIDALETGLDATEVRQRLSTLQAAKEQTEIDLRALTPIEVDPDAPEAGALLASLPDLTDPMRQAPPSIKRQLFEAFGLQITYDKPSRKVELTATMSEQLAHALKTSPDDLGKLDSATRRGGASAQVTARATTGKSSGRRLRREQHATASS